ncbi:MAG: MFS transporter [Actinobacteria bacterium]|nr:MFS transporter [Actinomycetota bacterium]
MTAGNEGALVALKARDYWLFWCGAIVSNSGNWMQTITVPFVIDRMTHSPTWVGFSAFMAIFPGVAVGPIGGSFADRFPRKQVVLVTQALMMFAAIGLWAVWTTGAASPEAIVALMTISGIGSGLGIASWQAFIPQLVPPDHMFSAIRLNSVQFTAARAFGPALAGIVLAEFGAGTAFGVNALSFVVVLAALVAIQPRPVDLPAAPPRVLEHFRAGVQYVRQRRALVVPVITIFIVSFFGSSSVHLCAPFAREVLEVGKANFGFMVASFGIGAVLGTFANLAIGDRVRRSRMAMAGLVMFAGGELVFGSAAAYVVSLIGLAGMGVAYMFIAVAMNTSIQARVDESHRGRVLAIYLMGLLAGVPLGALTGGAVADGIGLRATIIGGASAILAFAIVARVTFAAMGPLDETVPTASPVHADPLLTNQPTIPGAD